MADPASNLLSDALMGKPTDQTDEPSVASVSPTISVEPTPVVSDIPSDSALPSTEIPIPSTAPSADTLQATPVPIEPGKPLEAVSPTGSAITPAPLTPAVAPVKNKVPPAAIAGLAVLAVVTIGVVAAVVLSGESQELRQKAYVPLATPTAQPANPAGVVVVPSAENSFVSVKNEYPNAPSKPIVTDGIEGTLYIADNSDLGSKLYFAELTGLESSPTSQPNAWLTLADGTFILLGKIDMADDGKTGYIVSEQYADLTNVSGFLISYEDVTTVTELIIPGPQRVVHVEL